MKIRGILTTLTCAAGLTVLPGAEAQMLLAINPDAADARVVNNGAGTVSVVDVGDYAHRVGEQNAPGGSAYVFPFLLPAVSAGQQFTAASLRLQLLDVVDAGTGTLGNADFYGLGVRSTPTVLTTDYFQGSLDMSNVLVQDNLLTPASPKRTDGNTGPFVFTSTNGSTALLNYLNTVDPAGSTNAGQYVFFRLSYDLDPIPGGNNAYVPLTANAGGANEKPLLSLTVDNAAVPEPSTFAILGLSGIALAAFRRRRN